MQSSNSISKSQGSGQTAVLQITSNICKKQIHDVGTKVYLHTYNNEKRERDRFIKKRKFGFGTRNLLRGRRTLSRLSYGGCLVAARKLSIYC